MRDTHPVPAHLARKANRNRHGAALVLALGIGLITFAFIEGGDDDADQGAPDRAPTSEASVLGVVVTPEEVLPAAGAAAPATFDVPGTGEPRTTRTTQRSTTTSSTATTEPGATTTVSLIPPTSLENTTTTTEGSPSTILTTTTTEPTTTTAAPQP